ncbi:hypothetical protein K438DRAFT_1838912 [Mycena galopus ATCC 62051]|nr:hypothetical protein K438DRAFT_1838912 [Mycena galopus ATCC 62051]
MNDGSSGVSLSLPFVLPLTWDVFFWVPSLRYTVARLLRNRVVCVVPGSSTCSLLLCYPLFGKSRLLYYNDPCLTRYRACHCPHCHLDSLPAPPRWVLPSAVMPSFV